MAKAPAKTVDQLVLEALEVALRRGGEVRLVKFGNKPENAGLFSDDKGARKAAIERCLDGEPRLLQITRTEKVKNKEHRFATITPEGVDYLLPRLPAERANGLLADAVQRATEQAKGLEDRLAELLRRNREAVEQVQSLLAGLQESMEATPSRLTSEIEAVR